MLDRDKLCIDAIALADRDPPVRWLHQGRDPETGLDCVGFLRWLVMQQKPLPLALEAEFARTYHMKPDGALLVGIMRRWLPEIEISKAAPADILLFYHKRNPQHVALIVPNNQIVEAVIYRHAGISRVLRQPLDPQRRIVGAFRIPDEWTAATQVHE